MTNHLPLPQTLIILSGLPGCGKTTFARLLVQELHLPVLTIDDVVDAIPAHLTHHLERFWEDMVHILLHLVDAQLAWGHSVIVDSVFMGVDETQTQHTWSDRRRAYEMPNSRGVNFRPIYCTSPTKWSGGSGWRSAPDSFPTPPSLPGRSGGTAALFPTLAAGSGAFSGWVEQRGR
jgi:hypothetical protein